MTASTTSAVPAELLELLTIPGVSGFEKPVVDWLASRLPPSVVSERDAIGNLVARFGEAGPELLIVVHTDEVGFVVSGVRDDGALYVTPVGGWDLAALGGRQVDVHVKRGRALPGVVITVPPHLDRGLGSPPAWLEGDQVVVDVGVDDAAGVAALGVEVLQSVTLARSHAALPGGPVVARGLDNRFGCFLLLGLARRLAVEPPAGARVSLAWASQEEVGFRGPKALAHRGRYDAVIAVDAYPADRRPGRGRGSDGVRLGAGPVVRGVDLTGVGSVAFRDGLVTLARERGVPVQPAYARGHNQASVFPTAAAIALDIPIAYLHSAVESLHPGDLDGAATLLHALATHPKPEALWTP